MTRREVVKHLASVTKVLKVIIRRNDARSEVWLVVFEVPFNLLHCHASFCACRLLRRLKSRSTREFSSLRVSNHFSLRAITDTNRDIAFRRIPERARQPAGALEVGRHSSAFVRVKAAKSRQTEGRALAVSFKNATSRRIGHSRHSKLINRVRIGAK